MSYIALMILKPVAVKLPTGVKVKGIIHWVSAHDAIDAEVRLYDRLFEVENPLASDDFTEHLNPESLQVLTQWQIGAVTAASSERFELSI